MYGLVLSGIIGAQSYKINMSDSSQKLSTLLIPTIQKVLQLLLFPYVCYQHEHCKSKAQGFW